MLERESIFWKLVGPSAFALLLALGGAVYASVSGRVDRLERLMDTLLPSMSRIEEKTSNIEAMLELHAREDK